MDAILAQFYSPSLDLIMLVAAIAVDLLLAFAVYRANPKSATNRIFALLTVMTVAWLTITHAVRSADLLPYSLLLHRLGIFFAAPMSALFFLLAHTMPKVAIELSRPALWTTIGATIFMMAINISPYAFVGETVADGVSQPVPGIGLLPFSLLSTLFSLLTLYFLIHKYLHAEGAVRKQLGLVLSGIAIMLALIILTVLFPVIIYGSIFFLPFTPLYTLVFLGMTAYAITKYELFNMKVLVTQMITIALCVILFAKLFGEETTSAQVVDGLVLSAMVVFSFFLVRSVRREVEQRERIERLAQELAATNERQEGLIHFIGHEVKGFLTKSEGAFAALLEGDFGKLPDDLKPFVAEALKQTRNGVTAVSDILQAANLKKGTVTFKKDPLDLAALVTEVVEKARASAQAKGLALSLTIGEGDFSAIGDRGELEDHVFRNVIDNAIAYTPSGSVAVSLRREGNRCVVEVKDTGVGMSAEDQARLFTEGGHGKDSIKVNVHSTGYGLYIAKSVTEAHGGAIRGESDGPGKGSMFTVELPAASPGMN